MDLLFVGGGFENFNWLAAGIGQIPSFVAICTNNRRTIDPMTFAVQPPLFITISIFNCRTIDPVTFAIQIPAFGAGYMYNCRTIGPMKITVQIPSFGAVAVNFANWFLVTHTQR